MRKCSKPFPDETRGQAHQTHCGGPGSTTPRGNPFPRATPVPSPWATLAPPPRPTPVPSLWTTPPGSPGSAPVPSP